MATQIDNIDLEKYAKDLVDAQDLEQLRNTAYEVILESLKACPQNQLIEEYDEFYEDSRQTVELTLSVTFDPNQTDAGSIADALDSLLSNAMSTDGILDEYGVVSVGGFEVPTDKG